MQITCKGYRINDDEKYLVRENEIAIIRFMAGNSNSGGKRKYAGRKSNAAKLLEAGFAAPFFARNIQEIKWIEFLEADDLKIRLEAVKYLTDRIYGKAKQTIDSNISGELSVLSEVIAKARKRVE